MASVEELLKEIQQLLETLSGRFSDLADSISEFRESTPAGDVESLEYPPEEESESVDSMDDTQSLEPPPLEEMFEDIQEAAGTDSGEYKTSEMKAVSQETKKENMEESLAVKEKQPEVLPDVEGALPILSKLARLQEIMEKKGLEVSAKDFAFIPKSTEVYASLSEEDRIGSKGARIVLDCINFLDTISYKYIGEYYAPLQNAVAALVRSLAEFLQSEMGYRVFPLGETSRAEIEQGVPDYTAAVQEKKSYSSAPADAILAIRRRGATLNNDIVRKAQILVSSGERSEVDEILETATGAVASLKAGSERAAEMKLKAIGSLTEWREKLYGTTGDHALTVARYALNLLHTLENPRGLKSGEVFSGQTQRLKKINGRIISILKDGGLSEILVSVGGTFDESYDPSKYERKKVSSDKPEGTILGLLRRGFLDRNGIPIQKAVVAVSSK